MKIKLFGLVFFGLLVGLFVVVMPAQAATYTCSLNYYSPRGATIYSGDTVTLTLTSNIPNGVSIWHETRDGAYDSLNYVNTGRGSNFTLQTTIDLVGQYSRAVTVQDGNGNDLCSTEWVGFNVIVPPVMNVSISGPSSATTGQPVTYLLNAYTNTQDQSLIYKVNWGDGTVETNNVPIGMASGTQSHTYNTAGRYVIGFTATSPSNPNNFNYQGIAVDVSTPVLSPAITVTSPNGGEQWHIGEMINVRWRRNWMPSEASSLADVYYNTGNGNILLAGGVRDDSGLTMSVPSNFMLGSNYKIVVVSRGYGGSETSPLSDSSDSSFSVLAANYSTYSPTPTPTPVYDPYAPLWWAGLQEGDLVRGNGDSVVWLIHVSNGKKFKRQIFGPQVLRVNSLDFSRVKNVDPELIKNLTTSNLIRKFGDKNVYSLENFVPGRSATRRFIPSVAVFLQNGYDFDGVYSVSNREFNLYKTSPYFR